jgi:two-component system cell cycle sensor histidine kinase/response regulator CckA
MPEVPETSAESAFRGTETVLLVEDEEPLRRATAEFLSLRGYNLLETNDGQDALLLAANHAKRIDLAVTDIVMPGISAGQLVKELTAIRPGKRVRFVSGDAAQTILDHKVVDVENNFLQKPFCIETTGGQRKGSSGSEGECSSPPGGPV